VPLAESSLSGLRNDQSDLKTRVLKQMSDEMKAVGRNRLARNAVTLPNRAVVRISGDEARDFLDKLITADMAAVMPGNGIHAALLTPQGKIITDFFVTEAEAVDGGGFYLDVPLLAVSDLIKRLGFYKLRAKISIEDLSDELCIVAIWGGETPDADIALSFIDPRLSALGLRIIGHKSQFSAMAEAFGATAHADPEMALQEFHHHRANKGIGEAVFDYLLGDTFPHEINMDQLGGVDFKKGCYIGQEVVSRMQHRGTARTRLVPLVSQNGFSVAENIPVMVGDRSIGTTSTVASGLNLGMIRLDKAADAIAAGLVITAGAVEVKPVKPAWWTANWPIAES
jgi:tRNA-modifying protein YgfZ